MDRDSFDKGVRFLSRKGLNLFSTIACEALPAEIVSQLKTQFASFDKYSRLVLVGNGGRRFWESFKTLAETSSNPVDDYSLELVKQFMSFFSDSISAMHLFPSSFSYSVPLQKLGMIAGWSYPSPLGQDINPEYGLWFAFRSAFLTDLNLPLRFEKKVDPPCHNCQTRDCVGGCPAGAVQDVYEFKTKLCINYRLRASSQCSNQCKARLACPYASGYRYSLEQIHYHYTFSLKSMQRTI